MAEAAARDGYRVVALDVFGDADTRRAAVRWQAIARPGVARLDAALTLAALQAAAREPGVIGWVAGSDFECEPALLERGAAVLPLIGTAPADVRRLRDPAAFFDTLAAHGLPHPETRLAAPADPHGWLRKHALGAGGWHIRHADDAHPAPAERHPYYQRAVAGTPMSALFVANGAGARLIGCHQLIVRPLGAHPHVYRGAIGPLAPPAARLAALDAAAQALTATFALRGLASLDFIDGGEQHWLLELNPRPSASMGLHDAALMRAHVEACVDGTLPPSTATPRGAHATVRGHEVVFARTAFTLGSAQAAALAARADCHDLPAAGSRYAAGDPVCSVSACGRSADAVRDSLTAKRQALRTEWANSTAAASH